MTLHVIKKGLDLPITGEPTQDIDPESPKVTQVAILADDFPGMKPKMLIKEGDTVKRGQPLFEDRKTPGVLHTAPGAGKVVGIHRGAKRALQSVVIHLSEGERNGQPGDDELHGFESYRGTPVGSLTREDVVALLVESGLWTSLRKRPFSKVPMPDSTPDAVFVNAMDTNPLSPKPEPIIEASKADFEAGLQVISLLGPKTHLCVAAGSALSSYAKAPVQAEQFKGPHPAGTTGVHMHFVAPVSRKRTCWSIGYQDVIAIGKLFTTGKLDVSRVIAVAGPPVKKPRLVRARLGANLDELAPRDGLKPGPDGKALGEGDYRLISGSVLSGKRATLPVFSFLGRYHNQVSVLVEGREREFLGWLVPGANKFSVIPTFISKLTGGKRFDFTTTTNGSPRAMVPIGMYEEVMPMDILPTFLLRSMMVGDVETAEKLGILELDEEDMALCTFVCPGKTNYGPILRANLDDIERNG